MTFFFCDSGLQTQLGHHANSARLIVGELRRRGIETRVLAHQHVHPDLVDELDAEPWFRVNTYQCLSDDPIAGWLESYRNAATATIEDLVSIGLQKDDLFYFNSAQVAQLLAVSNMCTPGRNMELKPVVEFGVDPGLEVRAFGDEGPTQFGVPDPRHDPRATLYRYAAMRIGEQILSRMSLNTFEPWSSAAYSALLGVPVGVLPVPRQAALPLRRRGGGLITIGIIGHQRGEKGWGFVPEIAKQVMENCQDVRFLLHDGDSRNGNEEVKTLARLHARVDFDGTLADDAYWNGLLDRCDLIICPYMPQRFVASYSAIVAEAIANGIPLVVPARTALARCCKEYGDCAEEFMAWDAFPIASAVQRAVRHFNKLECRANRGAYLWRQRNGAAACVDAILAAAGVSETKPAEAMSNA